jgi:ABC-2 type transport system permease protein
VVPSRFLSGLLIDVEDIPTWVEWLGMVFPLHHANNLIKETDQGEL